MAESQEDRVAKTAEDFEKQIEEVQEAAVAAREANGTDEGETEEEYRERIANVPGIFGDTDTTAGADASGIDVVSADNEQATVAVAAVDAAAQDGDEEAQNTSTDEARRQVDAEKHNESAEEVDAASGDADDQAKADKKAEAAAKKAK